MTASGQNSFLDRPAARLCALAVAALALGALGWIHRDDLFPRPGAADAAAADCRRARLEVIDDQLRQNIITAAQAELFRGRVAALCEAMARKGQTPQLPPFPAR